MSALILELWRRQPMILISLVNSLVNIREFLTCTLTYKKPRRVDTLSQCHSPRVSVVNIRDACVHYSMVRACAGWTCTPCVRHGSLDSVSVTVHYP